MRSRRFCLSGTSDIGPDRTDTPGASLRDDFIEGFGITRNKLAVSIFVPPRRINEIVHGKHGTSEEFWMNLRPNNDLRLNCRTTRDKVAAITPLKVA